MRRPSFIFYTAFLGLNYFFGTLWYLLFTAVVAVGIAVALKKFVFWKYLTPDPPSNAAVLVTGTSTGIGRGLALRLAQSGVTVLATVRRQEDADNWRKEHPDLAQYIKPVILDVTNEKSIADGVLTVQEILKTEKKMLHSIVNNSGVADNRPIELVSKDYFDRVMETNTWGPIAVTKGFLPLLREYAPKGQAKIVFTSSVGVYSPLSFNAVYSASKVALQSIADVLRVEVNPFSINVILVEPGGFKASIFDKISSSFKTFANEQANNPIYDLYKAKGDAVEKVLAKMNSSLTPVSVLAEEVYHGLFGKFTPFTITASVDAAVMATVYWLLPESVSTRIFLLFDKFLWK